jgi:type 1 glutamine amidotransferase
LYRLAHVAWTLIALVATAAAAAPDAIPARAGKIKLLMVHNGNHRFDAFQKTMNPVLDKTGDFEIQAAKSFDALKEENLKTFDVVLFFGSGGKGIGPEQEQGLERFVAGGGGMAGVHATDANHNSDVYWRLMGGRFSGHGRATYMVRIEDKQHPVTAGMEDFEIFDETYRNKYHPEAKIHSLVRIDHGREQQSMAWVQEIGKGRVFCTTLGHGPNIYGGSAFDNLHFQRLVVRGLYWAAGREPKNP